MSSRAPRRITSTVRSAFNDRAAPPRSSDFAPRASPSRRPMPALPGRRPPSRDSRGGSAFRGSSSRTPPDIALREEREKSYRDLREERMQASKTLVSPAQQPRVGDIRAIYQDKALVVLNKPSGLVSQVDHTLDKADMEKAFTAARKQCSLPSTTTFYPVHRLDRATTGCLLLPTTSNLARDLSQQFQAKQIEKSYLAIVRGGAGSFQGVRGVVDARLFSHDGRVRLGTKGEPGREARTAWEVLGSSEKVPLSLLRLRPETGVKHQLRVHSAFKLQAPILGDDLHSRSRLPASIAELASLRNMDRDGLMFLHAHSIAFTRYVPSTESEGGKASKKTLRIAAPMPSVWTALLKEVGIRVEEESKVGGVWVDDEKVDKVEGLHGRWLLN